MKNGRILAISDIHGYGHLLKKLLIKANYCPRVDRLILLGDYINKGPDSLGTLQFVKELCAKGAVALIGNNERNWLKSDDKALKKWKSFIEQMPAYKKIDGFLFVHAGIRPGIRLKKQKTQDLTEIAAHLFWDKDISSRIIVFGHTPTTRLGASCGKIAITKGKLAIDTGAGHGKTLSLVDVTSGIVFAIETKKNSEPIQYEFPLRKVFNKEMKAL